MTIRKRLISKRWKAEKKRSSRDYVFDNLIENCYYSGAKKYWPSVLFNHYKESVQVSNYIVFGAAGSIGSAVAHQLLKEGHRVVVSPRKRLHGRGEVITRSTLSDLQRAGAELWQVDDVSDPRETYDLAPHCIANFPLEGVIYAVGHCPPGEFSAAIRYPLSTLPMEDYDREITMHQRGVLNIFQSLLPAVVQGGCFLFLSSAITRFKGNLPIQAHYHAGVISAEDWLIDGMRADPLVEKKNIKIHRIAPGAVDTPFHHGEGLRPPKMTPISDVVREVVSALASNTTVDKQLI